jgi:hypothetical protein
MLNPFNFNIDLPVRSEWKNVDLLRSSVQNCLTTILSDSDGCHAIAMIVAELLENAIKHGDWSDESPSSIPAFRLRVWSEGNNRALVSVENPITPQAVANLQGILDSIRAAGSADEAYRARLLEVAANPQAGVSGLGLVRVAYEGNCTLRAEPNADKTRVTVIAEAAL